LLDSDLAARDLFPPYHRSLIHERNLRSIHIEASRSSSSAAAERSSGVGSLADRHDRDHRPERLI